jgi:hypothetical protein
VCRALKVLCVARDPDSLEGLRRATVSSEWELVPGAVGEAEGLARLHEARPHVVVVAGPLEAFVARALEAYPGLRIVTDREVAGATSVVSSPSEIRDAVLGRARPGGPLV